MMMTVSIIVSGRVQGVFFRQSTREKAIELGIKGTVSNQKDGTVKIIATGESEKIKQLTEWARRGPAKAVVEDVKVEEVGIREFASFTVERS